MSDPLQMIGKGLTTVENTRAIDFLKEYCAKEEVEAMVVGQPRRMSGELSDVEKDILKFVDQLGKTFPQVTIHRHDERFTSKIAQESILAAGYKKSDRRKKELIDEVSAAIILNDFLESGKA